MPSLAPPGTISLAPMDGVTDHVYRDLLTARSTPGTIAFCVSEFIRVTDRPLAADVVRRTCPEVDRGGTTRAGVPVMVQLLGGNADALAETAKTAVAIGAFGIDLNFGCPAKLVNRHDGGAAILKCPERIEAIVARVRKAVPLAWPVSVKIRLGWESAEEVVPIALAAERGGASWITIHGRTKKQMYGPPADWSAIGRARATVGVAVIANGDLNTAESMERCTMASGCTHFMLGRGPMAYPALVTREGGGDDARQLMTLLSDYVDRLGAAGDSDARQVGRVKQWLSLASIVNPQLCPVFDGVKRLRERRELLSALSRQSR